MSKFVREQWWSVHDAKTFEQSAKATQCTSGKHHKEPHEVQGVHTCNSENSDIIIILSPYNNVRSQPVIFLTIWDSYIFDPEVIIWIEIHV